MKTDRVLQGKIYPTYFSARAKISASSLLLAEEQKTSLLELCSKIGKAEDVVEISIENIYGKTYPKDKSYKFKFLRKNKDPFLIEGVNKIVQYVENDLCVEEKTPYYYIKNFLEDYINKNKNCKKYPFAN